MTIINVLFVYVFFILFLHVDILTSLSFASPQDGEITT
jgi:hypothetical protein